MTPSTPDDEALLKRTLFSVGSLLGVAIVFVGTLSLVAALMVGRAVNGGRSEAGSAVHTASPQAPAKHAAAHSAESI